MHSGLEPLDEVEHISTCFVTRSVATTMVRSIFSVEKKLVYRLPWSE